MIRRIDTIKKGYVYIAFIGLTIFYYGCDKVAMQTLQVEGPIFQPPIHTKQKEDTTSVRVSFSISTAPKPQIKGHVTGHTQVNDQGVFEVETLVRNGKTEYWEREGVNAYIFNGNNFKWITPKTTIGINFEWNSKEDFFMNFGGAFGTVEENTLFSFYGGLGGYLNFGFMSSRIEFGYARQELWTNVEYIEHVQSLDLFGEKLFHTTGEILFWRKNEKDNFGILYGSVTLFTKPIAGFMELFFQGSYQYQRISSIDRTKSYETGKYYETESWDFVSITPGIAFLSGQSGKIYLGVRMVSSERAQNIVPDYSYFPFMQFEVGF
jgi:hypothetical protein